MERLEFEDYREFTCEIADRFDSLEDEFCDVSIIAKYKEAKETIRELLCLGYDVASIDIHDEFGENYYDEYIISVSNVNDAPSVWCEKFKRETGYINDTPSVAYVMDNCSSTVFKHIESEEIYEVCVGENDLDEDLDNDEKTKTEHTYTVNGKTVDKETFDAYVSKFAPELVDNEENTSDDDSYSISVKYNLDADEALELITDMERRMMHMNDMFREMDNFRRLFNW